MSQENAAGAGRILCTCYGVPETRVREAVRHHHLQRIQDVTRHTKAGGGCYTCWPEIRSILAELNPGAPPPEDGEEYREKIQDIMGGELQPLFDLNLLRGRLVDIEYDRVYVEFRGGRMRPETASVRAIRDYVVSRIQAVCGEKMVIQEVYVPEGEDGGLPTL